MVSNSLQNVQHQLTVLTGKYPIEPSTDIHAVCDLVKSWFRVLPEPVFPASSYFEIIEAMSTLFLLSIPNPFNRILFVELESFDQRLDRVRGIVQQLPQANFDLLKRVAKHLDRCVPNPNEI